MAIYSPHRLVIPEYPSAADGPADFQRFADSLKDNLVGIAVDEADRDTRYADVVPGGIVVSHERRAIWMRIPSGWSTVWEEPRPVDIAGATAASGWEINQLRGIHPTPAENEIRGSILRTGSALTAGSTGNGPDTTVLTLPSEWRPGSGVVRFFFGASATSGQAVISAASGNMSILDWHPGSTIDTDHFLTFSIKYSGRL